MYINDASHMTNNCPYMVKMFQKSSIGEPVSQFNGTGHVLSVTRVQGQYTINIQNLL